MTLSKGTKIHPPSQHLKTSLINTVYLFACLFNVICTKNKETQETHAVFQGLSAVFQG